MAGFMKFRSLIEILKFIYSEKATKFSEIFPLLLTTVHTVKSKGKISQNIVAFSEYMNFNNFQLNVTTGVRKLALDLADKLNSGW